MPIERSHRRFQPTRRRGGHTRYRVVARLAQGELMGTAGEIRYATSHGLGKTKHLASCSARKRARSRSRPIVAVLPIAASTPVVARIDYVVVDVSHRRRGEGP